MKKYTREEKKEFQAKVLVWCFLIGLITAIIGFILR